uniref:DUF1677 family protein n=1 Tax=Picea sitchensis TaxID=3332 RepID=A9P1F0_PICSI|nr:unknown [Picea sitchensis]
MATTSASSETPPGPDVPKIASSNPVQGCCEVKFAACECCGLTEECTPTYIARVRERFYGRWVCGLCGEAVNDELCRSDRLIGMEEALEAHMTFYMQLRADPVVRLVGSMRQLLRKILDSSSSPRGSLRSNPTNPRVVKEDVAHATVARLQAQKYE